MLDMKMVCKKVICLLLLGAMLLLAACKGDTAPVHGELYLADGIRQNTMTGLLVINEAPDAPLSEICYEVHNLTSYTLSYAAQDTEELTLEMYCDGEWRGAPVGGLFVGTDVLLPYHTQEAQSVRQYRIQLGEGRRYAPLEKGVYRMRIKALLADAPSVNEGFELVAYFTVS